jgi:hypothetical protein
MRTKGVRGADESASQEEQARLKQRLDDWLDDALADTFPASDPVASAPSVSELVDNGDRPSS